jgi:Kef-type K+ transport system membrane component KefB
MLVPGAVGAADATSVLVIVAVAALAGVLVLLAKPWLLIPVVVIELLLGIVIGPDVLDLAHVDATTDFFSNVGLGMLFFFAGYEIDFNRIRGRPLNLAALGWLVSLVLAYAIGGVLASAGVVLSYLCTKFGTYLLAAGGVGEFGPILLITLVLSTTHPLREAVILVVFVAMATLSGVFAVRSALRGWPLLERTMETSSQLAVRLAVLLVFSLVALASELGLDLLLGGFVAGLITRVSLHGREVSVFESKLTAVGYGLLIPFFFVTSGMAFDLDALLGSTSALLKLPMFVALFLVVRGTPAMLLYRGLFATRDRLALAIYSATELPLVVAITTIAVQEGHMRSSTSASLVGAAIVSALVFPLIGLRLRRGSAQPAVA